MIQYIFNKTIWKGYDRASQRTIGRLIKQRTLISNLCQLLGLFFVAYMYAPLIIICIVEKMFLQPGSFITIVCFELATLALTVFANATIHDLIASFIDALTATIYFSRYTSRGQAIDANDFKTIADNDAKLFSHISSWSCIGLCYATCFEICQALGKGHLEFVAIKMLSPHEEEEDYTMHVLYVNNGWAFDTFSVRQFPLDEIHAIYGAKVYRIFTYEDIQDKTYREFKAENVSDAYAWAAANDCYINWLGDKRP